MPVGKPRSPKICRNGSQSRLTMLAPEWLERGEQDPSVAALSQDNSTLSDLRKAP
jgi:hypothetical protein